MCAIEARLCLLRSATPLVAKWLKQHLTSRRKEEEDNSMVLSAPKEARGLRSRSRVTSLRRGE